MFQDSSHICSFLILCFKFPNIQKRVCLLLLLLLLNFFAATVIVTDDLNVL